MSTLNRKDFNNLSKFFRDRDLLSIKKSLKLSDKLIINYGDLFDVTATELRFNKQNKKALRAAIIQQTGTDPLIGLSNNLDRIDSIQENLNEKMAQLAPDEDYIRISQQQGELRLKNQNMQLPAQTSLHTRFQAIDVTAYDAVIVVENLTVFNHWHLANLPNELTTTLAVYRGDKAHTPKAVNAFLTQLPKHINVIAFTDLDPAGLGIANTTVNVSALLFPDVSVKQLREQNQLNKFLDQDKAQTYLNNQTAANQLGQWQNIAELLLANQLAVMQEHMLALNWPLKKLSKSS